MSPGLNRALQVRTADRLRAELPREEATGLPIVGVLSEADRRELCGVGGGQVAAVALCLDAWPRDLHVVQDLALLAREAVRLMEEHVRRTDLLGWLNAETLLVLAPGLDIVGARSLAARLLGLLADRQLEIDGKSIELRVRVGCACRSQASAPGWTITTLGAEAQLQASEPPTRTTVVA
jgi:hypothetical protein